MPDIKLAQLRDRTPVKHGISVMPDLNHALNDYAAFYAQACGREEPVVDLHPGDARGIPREPSGLQQGEGK